MLINLSELLSNEGDSRTYEVTLDMNEFKCSAGVYPIVEAKPFTLEASNAGKHRVSIHADVHIALAVPCDRCLEDVRTDIDFTIDRVIIADVSDSEGIEVEDQSFMDGHDLDIDKLVYPEIIFNLPAKTLCRPDCQGLCPRCGANLNHGECGCDRSSLDPRMSVIQDIFNNRKEV